MSAMANPKVAWAVTDPAPMSVVVRRADAANTTATEVERLLTKTPISADSTWLAQVGPDPKDAASELKALTQDPMYMKSRARVVSAEVWTRTLPGVQNDQGDKPNLLAAIDPDLGDSYAQIMAKKNEIAGEKALIEQEKAAIDDKNTSADDKKEHQATEEKLEKMVSAAEDEVAPLAKKFLEAAKVASKNASPDIKAKFAPAVANLLAAVDDADIANSAAAIRYPLAIRSILDSAKEMAPVFVADVIEEKTGSRPPGQLDVTVTLDGTKVTLAVKGLTSAQLGAISVDDVTAQAMDREQKWVTHAVGLLPYIGQTKETLSFEHDVLADLMDGFGGGSSSAVAVVIPAFDSKEVTMAVAKPRAAKVVATGATVSVSADAKASAGGKAGVKATGKADTKTDKADTKGEPKASKGATDKKSTTKDKGDSKSKVDHK
jgi:hypothetical protein